MRRRRFLAQRKIATKFHTKRVSKHALGDNMSSEKKLAETVNHTLKLRKNIRHVFWLYFVMFALLVGNIAYFVLAEAPAVVSNPFNHRMNAATDALRGYIIDSGGYALAHTLWCAEHGAGQREYTLGRDFVHIVGFDGFGRSGVEARHNHSLQSISAEILQRADNLLTGAPKRGNSIVLTANADLQRLVVSELNRSRGAIVVMEPSTGKVLAMASYPDFDPNQLAENWSALIADSYNTPLLNRATQGLYPPGSVFKVITASAAYRYLEDYAAFTHDCAGEAFFGGYRIQCYNATAHGTVDLARAFAVSCNTYFAAVAMEVGSERMADVAERAGFGAGLGFDLVAVTSSFVLNEGSGTSGIIQTAIGQGRTVVTPLHMAMITSAVANGGMMMRPYVVDHALTGIGRQTAKTMPRAAGRVFEISEAALLTEIMVQAVTDGSAHPVRIDGVAVAAKTGTAQNAAGDDHGWFVAFAPADSPRVAVAIVLEHSGGPRRAMQMTRNILLDILSD